MLSDGSPLPGGCHWGTGGSISADGRFVAFSNPVGVGCIGQPAVFLARTGLDSVSPLPSLISLSPSGAKAGSADLNVVVEGSNFVPGSVVRWNGGARTTFYLSSTKLEAVVLSGDLASIGSAQVTVSNPAAGGGTSGGLNFTITP